MKVAAATAAITVGLGALAVAVAAVLGRWRYPVWPVNAVS